MDTLLTLPASAAVVVVLFVLVIASAWHFRRWLAARETISTSDQIKCWEIYIKAVSTLAVVVAGLMAFLRYIDQRNMELNQQRMQAAQTEREFNIKLYGQSATTDAAKRVLLNEASDLAATLATLESLDEPVGAIARNRFERLYHGQLVLYEGGDVETAMIDVRDALLKWQRSGKKPTELAASERTGQSSALPEIEKNNSDFMRQLALRLAGACRKELAAITITEAERASREKPKAL